MTRIAVTSPSPTRGGSSDRARSRPSAPGRYDRLREARAPADGVGRSPRGKRADLVLGAVVDPWEDGKLRLQVAIDRRVDILEEERSHKRISEAAYLTGRQIQGTLEKLGYVGTVSWDGGSRGDPVISRELKHQRLIETTREVDTLMERVVGRIGMVGWRLLRRVIGDRTSFTDCAAMQGKSGERAVAYVAARFREDLEDLAEALAAKGKSIATPDDAYRAAAPTAPPRQTASIRGGTTRRRIEDELAMTHAALLRPLSLREKGKLQDEAAALERHLARIEALDVVDKTADLD